MSDLQSVSLHDQGDDEKTHSHSSWPDCSTTYSSRLGMCCWRCSMTIRGWIYQVQMFFNGLSMLPYTLIGATLGVLFGFLARTAGTTPEVALIIDYPGHLFIRLLKLLVFPFIVVSMLLIPANIGDISRARKIGSKLVVYYTTSSMGCVLVGLCIVAVLKPGSAEMAGNCPFEDRGVFGNAEKATVLESVLQIGDDVFEENLIKAFVENNILGLITFFLWFGFTALQFSESPGGKKFLEILELWDAIILSMLRLVISFTPVAVFSLLAGQISTIKDLCVFVSLGLYVASTTLGVAIIFFLAYPLTYLCVVRKNPFTFYSGIAEALVTAFVTASSAATLPVSMRNLIENNKISKEVSDFALPLGATVNMNGTAIYFPIAVLFLAGLQGLDITFTHQVTIGIVSVIVSVGASPIPGSGLIFLIVVLEATSIPVTGSVSYILAIDFFVDRLVTALNVAGDAVACAVIEKLVNDEEAKAAKKCEDEKDEEEGGEGGEKTRTKRRASHTHTSMLEMGKSFGDNEFCVGRSGRAVSMSHVSIVSRARSLHKRAEKSFCAREEAGARVEFREGRNSSV